MARKLLAAVLAATFCVCAPGADIDGMAVSADRITTDHATTQLQGHVKVNVPKGMMLATYSDSMQTDKVTQVMRLDKEVVLKLRGGELRADSVQILAQRDGSMLVTADAITYVKAASP